MNTFHTPNPVDLRVELSEGEVKVRAEDTDTTTVELTAAGESAQSLIDNATVEQHGDRIVVSMPKAKSGLFRRGFHIEASIVVPLESKAEIGTNSADISTQGILGQVRVRTGSGDVEVEHASDLDVRTGSGDIDIKTVTGSSNVKAGSAEIVIGSIGADAEILSGSGDIVMNSVGGRLKVKSGSGDVHIKAAGDLVDAMAGSGDVVIDRTDHGRVKAKTGSGDITIGVADGTAAYLDIMTVTGEVRSDLDGSDAPSGGDQTVEITIQSGTGDVVLQRA